MRQPAVGHQLLDEPPLRRIQSDRRHPCHHQAPLSRTCCRMVPACSARGPSALGRHTGRMGSAGHAAVGRRGDRGKVSIVICTRNRCAAARPVPVDGRQRRQIDRAEVLVVDNGSTDETAAIVGRLGVEHAQHAVCVRAEDRAIACPQHRGGPGPRRCARVHRRRRAGRPGMARWAARARIGAGPTSRAWPGVSSCHGPMGGLGGSRCGARCGSPGSTAALDPARLADREYPVGANMSVRRDIAVAVGGFDPALGYSGSRLFGNEEREFFDRVRRQASHSCTSRRPASFMSSRDEGDPPLPVPAAVRPGPQRCPGRYGHGSRAIAPFDWLAMRSSRALVRGWRTDIRRIARSGRSAS